VILRGWVFLMSEEPLHPLLRLAQTLAGEQRVEQTLMRAFQRVAGCARGGTAGESNNASHTREQENNASWREQQRDAHTLAREQRVEVLGWRPTGASRS